MPKEWSSFRITLLLYIVVLILPFSFYFVYSSFKTMQEDTKIVRQSSWVAGAMEHHTNDTKKIVDIDATLNSISVWANNNSDTKLYIGTQSLPEDLSDLTSCWDSSKNNLGSVNTQCYAMADTIALNIEKMVYLKQKEIINVFYISLALAMIFALLMIYLVRVFIHLQMKKHAIHDHETKLFNKKYFLSELKTSCARSQRYQYPLSMLSISIDNFEKYDKETKKHMLQAFGGLLTSLSRESDVACRYDDNHFMILLPDQKKEGLSIYHQRIQEALEKHDFQTTPKPEFTFLDTHYDNKESDAEFLKRSLSGLKLKYSLSGLK